MLTCYNVVMTHSFPDKLNAYIDKIASKRYEKSLFQVLVHSDKHGISIARSSSNTTPEQPFNILSVSKFFTATTIGMLSDEGLLSLDDTINKYLPEDLLNGLFVFDGRDYKDTVTIRNLLSHTSGAADFFEDNALAGPTFFEIAMARPDKMWTAEEVIAFTRDNQSAVGAPGKFHYSDTGFALLTLIIKKVTGKDFSEVLAEKIFRPLGMRDSYMMFFGKPENALQPITPVWLRGKEVSSHNFLSCGAVDGGIVSTLSDMVTFQKAYWSGKLVSESFMNEMSTGKYRFHRGLRYALGSIQLDFHEAFFLLRNYPSPIGSTGAGATHMYYDRENDVHIIMNMGSDKMMRKSFNVFIKLESIVKKYRS